MSQSVEGNVGVLPMRALKTHPAPAIRQEA
jgi:hypothetical protein